MKALLFRLLFLVCASLLCARAPEILPSIPLDRDATFTRSLNGAWAFKYLPALDAGADEQFTAPAYDASAWKTIAVPGHWELQGFAEPRYEDDLAEGLGLYRRAFAMEKSWAGRRVFLRFEGVLFGYAAYVNGKLVGESTASGFNQHTFDITDALAPAGSENTLAVRVTTRPVGWEFDNMDCWALSGIYRDVTVFSLPETHLRDYTTRTTLLPDGSARLDLDLVASAAGRVTGRLLSPAGALVGEIAATLPADGRATTSLVVANPALWSAESPSLYRLELALHSISGDGSATTHSVATHVGFRQVSIEHGILKLNGTPIKLRGVNHHEIWPEGRVSTDANTRRDLELIRDANINFIRTAHYPPHPRLLELCDEMGFYVLDEVPFVHGRQHLTDSAYQEILYTRARATVARDKNHASVLFWSIGNENPINELSDNTGRLVKQLDPTRPVMFPTIGSYFAANYQKMSDVGDIHAQHYPPLQRAREHAATLTRPIIFTEYAHQRGLARAGTGVQDLWEVFYQSPRIAGGALWLFQDQGILRTAEDRATTPNAHLMVWLDEKRYYDTRGFFAMDGLVYSDRTPQVDYWLVRKVYSPVQIKGEALAVRPGPQTLSVEVENRHDFASLAGFTLHWSLRQNRAETQNGSVALSAAPKQTERVAIPITLPATPSSAADVFTLELRCIDAAGRQLHERTLRLDLGSAPDARLAALRAELPAAEPALEVTDTLIVVRRPDYSLRLDRATGALSLLAADGSALVSAFGPHTGRNPTINDIGRNKEREGKIWPGSLLTEVTDLHTAARRVAVGVELAVSGTYARPDKPAESVRGGYRLLVKTDGSIDVRYDYVPVAATGEMLEAGFALALPAARSDFRWLGEGPYAGYPGKDRQNEYGLFHLHRDDLNFPGNRRAVELAAYSSPAGAGVLLAGNHMTVDLENKDDVTILSHLAVVPGEQSTSEHGENVEVSSRIDAATLQAISGAFTILPLSADWPAPLRAWFGEPGERVPVLKPFLSSYDQ